jgi:hypothetical protein
LNLRREETNLATDEIESHYNDKSRGSQKTGTGSLTQRNKRAPEKARTNEIVDGPKKHFSLPSSSNKLHASRKICLLGCVF